MAASFVVGLVLLFCILPLGDATTVGGSSYCTLPAARRLLSHPAQLDDGDAHATLNLGQLVDQAPPTAPKFGHRVLDISTSGLWRRVPKGYPPTPGNTHVITPPPAVPVHTPPPPTHVYSPPPPLTHIYSPPPPPPY